MCSTNNSTFLIKRINHEAADRKSQQFDTYSVDRTEQMQGNGHYEQHNRKPGSGVKLRREAQGESRRMVSMKASRMPAIE